MMVCLSLFPKLINSDWHAKLSAFAFSVFLKYNHCPMPILKNAKKALRSSARKAAVNQVVKSKLKTMQDKMVKNPLVENLAPAFSAIDKAKKNHLIHANKAARLKSRLSKLVSSK